MESNRYSDVSADEAEYQHQDEGVNRQTRSQTRGKQRREQQSIRQTEDSDAPSDRHIGTTSRTTHRQNSAHHHGAEARVFKTDGGRKVASTATTVTTQETHVGEKRFTDEFSYKKLDKSKNTGVLFHQAPVKDAKACAGTPGRGHSIIQEEHPHTDSTTSDEDKDGSARNSPRSHTQALAIGEKQDEYPRRKKKTLKVRLTTEQIRLTFFDAGGKGRWPHCKPTVEQCVQAGLKFVVRAGYSDLVECVRCQGTLHAFTRDDIPAKEHKRLYPNCN